ncbi:MAG: alkene reductase, partial [Betaproteobacteria bacterium]
MTTLFDPIRIGDSELQTRLAMAPLTRSRAKGTVPNDLMRQYYEQRANPHTGAGLIITEAAQISPEGQGYLDTPGIYSEEQVQAWKPITQAVHAQG